MALTVGLIVIAVLSLMQPPFVMTEERPTEDPTLSWVKLSVWGGVAAAAVMAAPYVQSWVTSELG